MSNFVQRGTPPAEATEKNNNQPHIIMFSDEDEDEPINQYFVSVEQNLIMESSSITAAIFFAVAAHYIFNLRYHPKAGTTIGACVLLAVIITYMFKKKF